MSLAVGVDAGATHTAAVVGDEQLHPLARATGGPGVLRDGRDAAAAAAIAATIRAALEASAVPPPPVSAIAVGAAGARITVARELARRHLEHAFPGTVVAVTTDAEIALEAAFGDAPGIVVCAGTGSVALGRCAPAGPVHWAGGLGPAVGDEGSGFWLGREAVRVAAGGTATTLTARLLAATAATSTDELRAWARRAAPTLLASLALDVARAAEEGDAAARTLVVAAARELALLVAQVASALPHGHEVPVALSGGLLSPGSPIRQEAERALAALLPTARVTPTPVDPPLGALRMAHRLAGHRATS